MAEKARLIGLNHVALEVGDVEQALALYGRIFSFTLRGRAPRMAFVDMGDQFVALSEGRSQPADDHRHFGLVVDDVAAAREAAAAEGLAIVSDTGGSFDFLDPWGNRSRSSATATSSSSGRTASSGSSASRRSRRPRKRGVRSRSAGWPDPGPKPRPCRAPPGACG